MSTKLTDIKTAIKLALDVANTITASADLSADMTTRVKNVYKVNPFKIPIHETTNFPLVTVYCETDAIQVDSIGRNQLASRYTDVTFNIQGAVCEEYITDGLIDTADEQIERLMPNIEAVLRQPENLTLGGSVKWHKPGLTQFHAVPLDEETHLRIGTMQLQCRVYY